ncbi:hypothetical protein ACSBR2_031743 [Camellia fascicularis]
MSVPFQPRHPSFKPLQSLRALFGDDYYMCRFQERGEVEEKFASCDTGKIISAFLSSRDTRPLVLPKELDFKAIFQAPIALPSWLTEEDINYYAGKFNQTGFTGGLNYYRALDLYVSLLFFNILFASLI